MDAQDGDGRAAERGDAPAPPAATDAAVSRELAADAVEGARGASLLGRAVAAVEGLRDDRERRAWVDVAVRMYERYRGMGGSLLAGALGYRLFLVMLPLALLSASALGFALASAGGSAHEAADTAGLPGLITTAIESSADTLERSRWWTVTIGSVLLLWASLTLLRALRTVNALAWRLPIRRLTHAARTTVVFSLCLVGGTALSAVTNGRAIPWWPLQVAANIGLLFAYGALWLVLSDWLPHRSTRLGELLPGAILFAVGMKAFRLFVVIYVTPRFDHGSALYGAFGTTTAVLLALYVFGTLIVASAVLNTALWERRQERSEVDQAGPAGEPEPPD